MASFSIAIQGVATRHQHHIRLEKELPRAKFAIDYRITRKVQYTWRAALELADPTADYHLILQDDVTVCPDFEETVLKIIGNIKAACPVLPHLALYCPKRIIAEMRGSSVNFVRLMGGAWGQAHMYPVSRIQEFLEYDAANFKPDWNTDDGRLEIWSMDTREPIWATAPSLVQHLGANESTIGFSNKNKVAAWFAEESPLGMKWNPSLFVDGSASSLKSFARKVQKGLRPELVERLGL
jgi:hypothetical protein